MDDRIDLYWIPLGAGTGGALVRGSGRAYEAMVAARRHRPRQALFHSALAVHVGGVVSTIEMAPVWTGHGDRGVVAEGPVGARFLGRSRLFRYEVRCWAGGSIPDAGAAVAGPHTIHRGLDAARRVVELAPSFPTCTWGRDELGAGEMWNSNSLVSWLLARAGVWHAEIRPPRGGRAPGWDAGLTVATRALTDGN